MKSKGTRQVNIADLKRNVFVREELDQDHVLYLAELVENGVSLANIKVSDELVVVDGRHRIEAYELNKIKSIPAGVYSFESEAELIAEAYKANAGGSKPPTSADTEHTVSLLLEQGESMKRIAELLALPVGMTRRYANEVKSRMNRAKLQRAVAAVTEGGLTVAKATEQYGVESDKLKEVLSGRRRKQKQGVQELHRELTKVYRSLAQRNAVLLKKLIQKLEDGDVSQKQVGDLIEHLEDLQTKSARSLADWKSRIECITAASESESKLAKSA